LPDHPANFTVVVTPCANKFKVGGGDEITFYLLIKILKLVAVKPDVITRSSERVRMRYFIVLARSGIFGMAYISMIVKQPHGCILRQGAVT